LFIEFPPTLKQYQAKVHSRLTAAYRPATLKAQKSAIKILASFCILYELKFLQVAVTTILSFIEFLADSRLAPATIKNYLCSVKANFCRLGMDIVNFESNLIKLALRSLECNAIIRYKLKPILSIIQVQQLLAAAFSQPLFKFFRFAVLFAFIGMLRISNIACISMNNFDALRHITRGDVTITPQGLSVHIKWSKTLQSYRQSAVVHLPRIMESQLCPFAAFQELLAKYPLPPSAPLLAYPVGPKIHVVTKSQLQTILKQAAAQANLPFDTSFHIFRRSAASIAFAAGVPFKQIQAHGMWTSEAVWSYIHHSAKASVLPNFFKNSILSVTTPTLGLGENLPSNNL
jgi:integrase